MRVGSAGNALAGGKKKMKDKHVQCIGADDKDGGEHEKSAWELHVWKMVGSILAFGKT